MTHDCKIGYLQMYLDEGYLKIKNIHPFHEKTIDTIVCFCPACGFESPKKIQLTIYERFSDG